MEPEQHQPPVKGSAVLAQWFMKSYWNALLGTLFAGGFFFWLPPLFLVVGAPPAVVTLRQGWLAGLRVWLGAMALLALIWLAWSESALPQALMIGSVWCLVWGVAVFLRWTADLARSVFIATVVVASLLVLVELLVGEQLVPFWQQHLSQLMGAIQVEGGAEAQAQLEALFKVMAHLVNGGLASTALLTVLASLFVARWWQASLYNPGGFGAEFRQVHLRRTAGGIGIALLALFAFGSGRGQWMAVNLLMVVAVMYLVVALSLAHWLRARRQASVSWLVLLYGVIALSLLTPALSWALPLVAMVGFADCWVDFRRLGARSSPS